MMINKKTVLKEDKMNIIEYLIKRIEDYRETNKQPCKNYATKERAEKATKKVAEICGRELGSARSARYIVFYNEAWGRWVGAIDLSEMQSRSDFSGGYLGIASYYNFYSY
tara:strand:+ start:269 stop:598 length:330 start_codon:yes stop_codon:yes gene_type:complete